MMDFEDLYLCSQNYLYISPFLKILRNQEQTWLSGVIYLLVCEFTRKMDCWRTIYTWNSLIWRTFILGKLVIVLYWVICLVLFIFTHKATISPKPSCLILTKAGSQPLREIWCSSGGLAHNFQVPCLVCLQQK